MRSLICMVVAFLGLIGDASAQEYRRVTLSDGRVLVAEIQETSADGMYVRIPQGQVFVGFTSVLGLEAIAPELYTGQPRWVVTVLPITAATAELKDDASDARDAVEAGLRSMPHTVVPDLEGVSGNVPSQVWEVGCGIDAGCAEQTATSVGFTAALTGRLVRDGDTRTLVLVGAFAGAPSAHFEGRVTYRKKLEPDLLLGAVRAALGMESGVPATEAAAATATPPADTATAPTDTATAPTDTATAPTDTATAPTDTATAATDTATARAAPDETRLARLSWVPVPGLPAAARGDWAGFGLSWAVVVPGAAAMVHASGRASLTRAPLIGLSALSTYVLTVATNQVVARRPLGGATVAASPVAGGGAVVTLSAPLP